MKAMLTFTTLVIIFSMTSVYAQNDYDSRIGVGAQLSFLHLGPSVKYYYLPYKVSFTGIIGLVKGFNKGYAGRIAYNWSFGESDTEYIYLQAGTLTGFGGKMRFAYSPGIGYEQDLITSHFRGNVELGYLKFGSKWIWAYGLGCHVYFNL